MQNWDSPINLYSIHLNRVVLKLGNVVTVWDFVAATSATWRVVGKFHRVRSVPGYTTHFNNFLGADHHR